MEIDTSFPHPVDVVDEFFAVPFTPLWQWQPKTFSTFTSVVKALGSRERRDVVSFLSEMQLRYMRRICTSLLGGAVRTNSLEHNIEFLLASAVLQVSLNPTQIAACHWLYQHAQNKSLFADGCSVNVQRLRAFSLIVTTSMRLEERKRHVERRI
jgi:hypothetical protein